MTKGKKDPPKNVDLIFDIRNSSVGLGIVEIKKNEKIIIHTERKYSNPAVIKDVETFKKQIENLTDDLIDIFLDFKKNNNIIKVQNINCVFSTPWYEANIDDLTFSESKKTKFTKKYLEEKITKVDHDKSLKIVEDSIISIFLNGYDTENPFNKKFNNIKFSLYRSYIDIDNKINEKISEKINHNKLNIYTHPFVILNVLRTNFHNINDFCLFDIGGEMTEISIFRDSMFKNLITIPTGLNSIIRNISKKTNNEQITISKIKMLNLNQIKDEGLLKQINSNIEKWFNEISNTIKLNEATISKDIFITIDKDYKKIIKDIFSKKDFYSTILNRNNEPNIRIIDSVDHKNMALYKEGVTRDPLISIIYNFSTIEI
jgi:hypothetical protein